MNFQTNKKDGFTIIEVVLVLAIAGLIFLMVFLALPALQRNQRDTQRKTDVSQAISQLQNYTSSKRGKLPSQAEFATFWSKYMVDADKKPIVSPSGEVYTVVANASEITTDQVAYSGSGKKCNDDSVDGLFTSTGTVVTGSTAETGVNNRQAAIAIGLENGVHCLNLQ